MSALLKTSAMQFAVYLLVRIIVCVMQALSYDSARAAARFLGWFVHGLDKRHREVARDNLRKAFPDQYSEAQIDQMVRDIYVHLCMIIVDIAQMRRRLHLHNYKTYSAFQLTPDVSEVFLSGRPILFASGHFGNWEMAGYTLGMFGIRLNAVARPLDNPYLDEYLRDFRERTGQRLIAKRGDFDRIDSVLAEGGVLAALADQDAGHRGMFVNFFGRLASTHKSVALLALEHNVPIIVGGMPFVDGKFQLLCVDVIYPEDYRESRDPIKEITQRFTTGLEKMVRQCPEQYFWVHRRWKSQPQPRVRKKAA
ncbi:MAG: lipid A biosynthesis acyltransferase [Gemmataceae bacterium]|nr:lipid A biosynthesis acyltransferase [Gemmataceae bacterium]